MRRGVSRILTMALTWSLPILGAAQEPVPCLLSGVQSLFNQPHFQQWDNKRLVQQTHVNLEYLKTIPHKYPDQGTRVNNRIVIQGWPGKENNLFIKKLQPEQFRDKTFRFFTTREGLEQALKEKRLIAQGNAFASGPYYYQDFTGVLLYPTDVDLSNAASWMQEQRFWVDVKLDPNTALLQLDETTYLIPGTGPVPEWLKTATTKEFAAGEAKYYPVQKMGTLGLSATEVPHAGVVDSSVDAGRMAQLRKKTVFAKKYKDQPLFEMFYALKGEEHFPLGKRVDYFTSAHERASYRVSVKSSKKVVDAKGNALTGEVIGVLLPDGDLLMTGLRSTDQGLIQHSSFNAGGPVLTAFQFKFEAGQLISALPKSGHYLPTQHSLRLALDKLSKMGADVSKVP